ncbi:MAG: type II toxin-antitoxin system RelE/ParE family toxin [Deltaproteobacteria bacterium]|nr:type II toxin-antitoxin system RelE/ParE family toxin [Deltaproteobacteria bacterium]
MSKRYHVRWAAAARVDLQRILSFIAADSPGNALNILKKIRRKTTALYTMPDRGRIVPELKDQGIHLYREIMVNPWRILYRITDTTVFVVSVIDSRRNVEDILLDRLVT